MLTRLLLLGLLLFAPPPAAVAARAGKCEAEYRKVNDLIEGGFKMSQEPVLPVSLKISVTHKEGKLFFKAARRIWLDHWPNEELLAELNAAYRNGTPVAEETLKKVGAVRGRLKTVRFLCEAICKDHVAPPRLDQVTSILGKLVDANHYSQDLALKKKILEEVMQLLSPASMKKMAGEIERMRPDHRGGNSAWFRRSLHEVEEALAKPTLTENEFHDVRKQIGRIQTALLFDGMKNDDQEKLEAVSWLSRLYMRIGGQHDEMIKQGYQTGSKPQENVFEEQSRQWIEEAVEAAGLKGKGRASRP